jgi:NAD(P)-dependent dehydrogenase (short-subunit alcohol dehydrogenase family)
MTDRKVWMVTGSSRGLGRAIVKGLLERGELVSATARNAGDLEGLKAQFGEQVRVAALDVTRPEDAKRVIGEASWELLRNRRRSNSPDRSM